jgi:hypothetical protein
VLALVSKRQPAWVSLGGWLAIDRHERSAGRQKQRPRVKLTDIPSMLDAAKLRDEGPGGPRLARDVES